MPGDDRNDVRDSSTHIQQSYDAIAREYADEIYEELAGKPFDRELLDRLAKRVGRGRVGDLGCGPAQIARYLRDRGVNAFGLDFSSGMLAQARHLNPEMPFVQTSMFALGLRSEALDGITAFYSIIHVPRERVVNVLGEMRRVLKRGGLLLIAFHLGSENSHHDELFGQPVNLDVAFFTTPEMTGYLEAAGFGVEEVLERDPYAPEVEYQRRRGYIFAARPRN
jgi:SAM-dependent methyltransferase